MRAEHALQPARAENEVVVEQREVATVREGDSAVVGGSVAEIALVKDHAERRREGRKPVAGAVGAAVVNEDNFVSEPGGQSWAQTLDARAREREIVEKRYNKRDLHAAEA